MAATTIFTSDCIFTAEEKEPFQGYIAVQNDSIMAIGKGELPKKYEDTGCTIIHLGDKTIVPGLIDVHCFFTGYAVRFVGKDFSDAKSIDDIFVMLEEYVKELAPWKPILGHNLAKKYISKENAERLNKTYPDRVVILFTEDAETCLMNNTACKRYDFTPDTCYPESYVKLLPTILEDRAFIVPMFQKYMHMMNSRGVTGIKEMGFDRFYGFTDILKELELKSEAYTNPDENACTEGLTLRVDFMSQPVNEPMSLAYGKKMREQFTGDFVSFSGYNQMTDGSVSEVCADLKEPYLCAATTCAQEIDWNALRDDVHAADSEGFRFSLHAQGDAAISKVLNIYETCKRDSTGKLCNRHCITDLEYSDPKDFDRMGKLGAIAEIYPQIQSIANRKDKLAMIDEKIGPERGKNYWNRRKMADCGVRISCGTDLPLLFDSLPESIYHAVGGFFPEGGAPFNEDNMLSIEEVITAWTLGGAINLGKENKIGSLAVGKKADFVIFDGNLFTTPMDTIRNRKVEATYLNGRRVFPEHH